MANAWVIVFTSKYIVKHIAVLPITLNKTIMLPFHFTFPLRDIRGLQRTEKSLPPQDIFKNFKRKVEFEIKVRREVRFL